MDAYSLERTQRALAPRVAGYFRERFGAELVHGFSAPEDMSGAVAGGSRIAGFMETHDLREWYVPLKAKRPVRWRTAKVPATNCDRVCFAISTGFGNGSPLPQPSGAWELLVNGRRAVVVRVVKHSQLWRQGDCAFAFSAHQIESAPPFGSLCLSSVATQESFAAFGPGLLVTPTEWVTPGEEAELEIRPAPRTESARWMQLMSMPGLVQHSDMYTAMDVLEGAGFEEEGYNLYFGDIHTHSGQAVDEVKGDPGCGVGSRRENYEYARGPGGLDFYGLTDHEFQVGPGEVSDYLDLATEYEAPGRFVCLPAFEFTSLCHGHRNVYFRGDGGTVVNANRGGGRPTPDPEASVTPEELWKQLEALGVPFITVPHHPSSASHPLNWRRYSPKHDRLAEVYSVWGSSEYHGDFPKGVTDRYRSLDIREGLARGYRFGLIASADGHDGHPGNAQSPMSKHHHQFHHLGSGRAVVLAHELTREAVFDALHGRRCYGTTGVPIRLWFDVDGRVMGTEAPAPGTGHRPVVRVRCTGANGLDHVRIVRNGRVAHTVWLHGERSCDISWEDPEAYDGEVAPYYYARVVQVDLESAWSSPVWLG